MSDIDMDALLAELSGGGASEETAEKVEEAEVPAVEPEKVEEDPLAGLLDGNVEDAETEKVEAPVETDKSEEAPVAPPVVEEAPKKRRGRPKGSTAKKKEPEVSPEEEQEEPKADTEEEARPAAEDAQEGTDQVPELRDENEYKPKDIYILAEAQIFNGEVYRRGQKIRFVKGDRFYKSQEGRDGTNWLDHVDDLEFQFAHFGRVIVEPDTWSGIPLGSTTGIEHPGIALAVRNLALEEAKRNGTPYN